MSGSVGRFVTKRSTDREVGGEREYKDNLGAKRNWPKSCSRAGKCTQDFSGRPLGLKVFGGERGSQV